MAHRKSKEKLLADAKRRQEKRRKAAEKLKELQQSIPRKIPGVPSWATGLARRPEMVDASQLAFSQQANEAAKIMALEYLLSQSTPHAASPGTVVPQFLRDAISEFEFPGPTGPVRRDKPPRKRTPKQMVNDELQSIALTEVNLVARKKDGSWKKGWNQRRVMKEAQKRCTKQRERLGLCKRKSTRKGQRRKTARRAYDSRLNLTRKVR